MEHQHYYQWQGNKLVLNIYLQPRASKDEIVGPHNNWLKIRVTAPPVDGKANKHLQKFLAKTFAVATSNVTLLSGKSSRNKQFAIEQPQTLPPCIPAKSGT